jgi:hypothetical protein
VRAANEAARRAGHLAQAEATRGSSWPSFVDPAWAREGEDSGRALVQIGIPIVNDDGRDAAIGRVRTDQAAVNIERTAHKVKQALIEARALLAQKEATLKDIALINASLVNARELVEQSDGQPTATTGRLKLEQARLQLSAKLAELQYDLEAAQINVQRAYGRP